MIGRMGLGCSGRKSGNGRKEKLLMCENPGTVDGLRENGRKIGLEKMRGEAQVSCPHCRRDDIDTLELKDGGKQLIDHETHPDSPFAVPCQGSRSVIIGAGR